jgi:hypothetical protein
MDNSVDCEKVTKVMNCNYSENNWSGKENCYYLLDFQNLSKCLYRTAVDASNMHGTVLAGQFMIIIIS